MVSLKKSLHSKDTPKFATVKGHLINKNDKWKFEQRIILPHLQDHAITIKALIQEHKFVIEEINHVIEITLAGIIIQHIHKVLGLQMKEPIKLKNQSSNYLIKTNIKPVRYDVLIINTTVHQLTTTENQDLNLD